MVFIRVNLKMEKSMDKANFFSLMEPYMKVNMSTIKRKVWES